IRVGFLSKYFSEHEPHGLLLEGPVRLLPRDRFEVALLVPGAGGLTPPAPALAAAADRVVPLTHSFPEARLAIANEHLDVLVYADMMSEPLTHFLGHARLAAVQCLFWGNPTTSGQTDSIDYFISADQLEHPNRTWASQDDEPYSEQVKSHIGEPRWYQRELPRTIPASAASLADPLRRCSCSSAIHIDTAHRSRTKKPPLVFLLLLKEKEKLISTPSGVRDLPPGGAAGWPGHLVPPASAARPLAAELGLPPGAFVYLCPQSLFKLHPDYDRALREVLRRAPTAHLVFLEGRRPAWTRRFRERFLGGPGPGDRG
ncbi:unnamed protein product, partial [Heterosigma akashiwo]